MERLFLLSDLVCAIAQATNANSANSTKVFMSADDVVDQLKKNNLTLQRCGYLINNLNNIEMRCVETF